MMQLVSFLAVWQKLAVMTQKQHLIASCVVALHRLFYVKLRRERRVFYVELRRVRRLLYVELLRERRLFYVELRRERRLFYVELLRL